MSARTTFRRCAAARAISLLVTGRDMLELAGRAPGDLITISRQDLESILNDSGVVEDLILEMTEGD